MKQIILILMLTIVLLPSCKKDSGDNQTVTSEVVVIENAIINTPTTWYSNKKYLLKGFNYVDRTTLTIQPGTIIKGDKATKGSLIIKPGAKIIAEGTVTSPIVFTSNQPKGSRQPGDWGGVIILGNARVNKNPSVIEGENITTFGGDNNSDNSGILKYVRIEFAGIPFETDKEINGLTLAGVGSNTIIDYVQVSHSGDDSFEWFGGTVNASHLIAYSGVDDDFDSDNGYSGLVQYGLALRNPVIADQCSCSTSNGIESDNDGSGSAATPQTSAKFANLSFILGEEPCDAKYNSAIQIRRNSGIHIYNSLVIGAFNNAGLEIKDASTQSNYTSGLCQIRGLALLNQASPTKGVDGTIFSNNNNFTNWTLTSLGLNSNFNNLITPVLLPASNSLLLNSGVTLPSGFQNNSIVGAFGSQDWTSGWANFDPQNVSY
ncbi:MAG: T9SS C-terminal target domain-containing protein [Saprospiraceae bacterium]|nr:T9SS C-terminal target domain-containing protein [Saprospiraceae bacterium]